MHIRQLDFSLLGSFWVVFFLFILPDVTDCDSVPFKDREHLLHHNPKITVLTYPLYTAL